MYAWSMSSGFPRLSKMSSGWVVRGCGVEPSFGGAVVEGSSRMSASPPMLLRFRLLVSHIPESQL